MDTIELEQKALAIPDEAKAIVITDSSSYEHACAFLLNIKALLNECDNAYDSLIKKAYQTHQEAIAKKKHYQEPLLLAEKIIKPRVTEYLAAQEHQRKVAEKKAQEDAALQEAVDSEVMGDRESAEAALNGRGVASVNIPSSAPKIAGIATRELWSAEVTDFVALVKAVAAGQVPTACLLPNTSALNQQARALKQDMKYPGVRPICIKTVAAGARL